MTMTAPKVSLCLLVRNEARFIAETLDSIARQTFGDFEVHIFDNASDDATPEICAGYLGDPRFRYYRNAANIGMVANFNRCHGVARGTYVALLSGNDVLADTYLEKLVAMADADPAIGLAVAQLRVIEEDSTPRPDDRWVAPTYFETDPDDPVAAGSIVVRRWQYGYYVFGLYRRTVLETLQPMRALFGADAAFVFELSLYARIRVHPEPLFMLRRQRRPQVRQVQLLFSEDAHFGVQVNGPFSHFDLVSPYVDQTWGFLETASFARIPNPAKGQLCGAIVSIQRGQWASEIDREVAGLKQHAPAVLRSLRARPDRPTYRAAAYRLLGRLGRAAVVAPPDAALSALIEEAARCLRPEWPSPAAAPP
jgi:glycosyltransferase involved in cell wall biosynthesis